MLLPLAALAFSLLVKALALSGLQDFAEDPQQQGLFPLKDQQYILTGTRFSTKTCVHQVKVFAQAQGGIFALDVWRPNGQSSYTLASSVEFTPREQIRTVFLLDASPPVQFQADDLVGFHLVNNADDFQVAWTSAPGVSLTMSTQRGSSPVTTFPGSLWMATGSTWPILFLSTSDTGICPKSTFATDSQTSTKTLKPSPTKAASSTPPNEIMPASSTLLSRNIDASSSTVDMSPDFPGDSSIPPEGIAGIIVAATVVIVLLTSSTILIAVCSLKTRKGSLSWKGYCNSKASHPVASSMLMNSLATSTGPLIQGEEPRGAVAVVIQPNPAYATTFTSNNSTAPSALPPSPEIHNPLVVMQPNPAYATTFTSNNSTAPSALPPSPEIHNPLVVMQPNPAYATTFTSNNSTAPSALPPSPEIHNPLVVMQPNPAYSAAHPTVLPPVPPPASSTALPTPLHGFPSLLPGEQTKQHQVQVDGATDHTYSSVSSCTAGTNAYEYVDH